MPQRRPKKIFARKPSRRVPVWTAFAIIALFFGVSYIVRISVVSPSTITGIARFKDGDSGFVGDTEIRLHCIDAAEYDTVMGREAAQFAWHETDGQHLTCTRRQRKLSWGRVVVSCVFDTGPNRGRNVNRLLVDAGHARYVSALCAAEAVSW